MQKSTVLEKPTTKTEVTANSKLFSWLHFVTLTCLTAFLFVFMEWLFFVTKPSFMDLMSLPTRLGILLLTWLLLVAVSLPFLLLLGAVSVALGDRLTWRVPLWLGGAIPAGLLASTALMLVDNFTYTLFKFGVVSTHGLSRGVYGAAFLLALLYFFREVARTLSRQMKNKQVEPGLKAQSTASLALLALAVPLGGALLLSGKSAESAGISAQLTSRPNIVLIGSDGVNAEHMSLYGYERETTPFLEEFAQGSLVSENNFTNSTVTAGSLVSMFTSKLPTETRMLYPPDIVRGSDSFEHLPRLLKQAGYYNAQISVDYYGDANILNLQDGFVLINDRPATIGRLYTFARRYLPEDPAYFVATIAKRYSERMFHIFYLRAMVNPYTEATQKLITFTDQDKLNQVKSLFQNVDQPLFVHMHLMGTHEGNLSPTVRVFSEGEQESPANQMDFYDDAILSFDGYMRQLVDMLKETGRYENTLIVVYTDHGMGNVSNLRLPLLMRFPGSEHAGMLASNTQNLDIAPTILDYLGVMPPKWMQGRSLLQGEPPVERPIFSAAPNYREHNDLGRLQLDVAKVQPPFYQFGMVGMVICQNWYALDTDSLAWQEAQISGYPNPCPAEDLPSRAKAQQLMLDQLQKNGFDVSSLREVWGD